MRDYSLSFKQWLFVFALTLFSVYFVWGDALKGYFIADDVWQIPLAYRALHGEPWLLWNQFLAPYSFHECLYRMYRPLTDITFALDCWIYGDKAWGYHLTNLIWHAISMSLVYVLSRSLVQYVLLRGVRPIDYDHSIEWKIPFAVALLFGCYPGHAEPICWPLPRIDAIAAAFTFASMIFSLEYFDKHDRHWLIFATVAMIPGLLIKEMCATIPVLVVALYVIGSPWAVGINRTLRQQIAEAIKLIWPMFAVLAVYLVVRAIALRSLLGGYVGTIGDNLNGSFLTRLFSIESYWRLLHPINVNVLGQDNVHDWILRGIYIVLAVLIVLNQRTACAPTRLRAACRILVLLLIMILPCLQIWGVTSGLIGARLAYTLCVPFLLAIVILSYPITSTKARIVTGLRYSSEALRWAAFVLFFIMSMTYARAWSEATQEIATIRRQLEEHVSYMPDGQKLVVIGLPLGIKGFCAFYTIDFLPGLLVPPLSKSDVTSKLICIDGTPTNDHVINLTLLKQFKKEFNRYQYVVWQEATKKFIVISLPNLETPDPPKQLQIDELGKFKRHLEIENGMTYFANNTAGDDITSYMLKLDSPAAPMDYDVLELKVSFKGRTNSNNQVGECQSQDIFEPTNWNPLQPPQDEHLAWISWSGQMNNSGESALPISFPVFANEKERTYSINLTQYKSWLLSGSSNAIRLDIPAIDELKLESAMLKGATELIPELSFAGKGELTITSLIATTPEELHFKYDVSKIPAAASAVVEVSEPYFEFHMASHTFRQTTRSKKTIFSKSFGDLSGKFEVPPDVVKQPAYYQIRVCALDSKGAVVGSFSDPITVSTVALP